MLDAELLVGVDGLGDKRCRDREQAGLEQAGVVGRNLVTFLKKSLLSSFPSSSLLFTVLYPGQML